MHPATIQQQPTSTGVFNPVVVRVLRTTGAGALVAPVDSGLAPSPFPYVMLPSPVIAVEEVPSFEEETSDEEEEAFSAIARRAASARWSAEEPRK